MGVVAVGLLLLLGLLFAVSLSVGAQPVSLPAVWAAVMHPDGGRDAIIVWQLRMPRTLLAVGVGVLLAVAGVLMQAITRNPLAEPGLLGVNAGASLAVVITIGVFGMGQRGAVMGAACLGAAGAAVVVMLVAVRSGQRAESTRLVLAGAALTASLSSVTGVITLADERTFGDYRSWVIGSVANRDLADMGWLIPVAVIVVLGAMLLAQPVELLAMGDEAAASLGVAVPTVRLLGFALVVVACGSATAVAGPISFVGLVVPHAVRLLLGNRMRAVLLGSLFAGATLLLTADIIGRVVAPPGELEAGIVTAFIGAPVLIGLVLRRRRIAVPTPPGEW
ncbi:FecCD family ABC transporter permease [Curtobacterium sp. ME12]|uniref:FecCD family ABC transporter permease n=1 Tax=Curtobacterium sp. ME12 TaxID=2744253 RepID=UPI0015F42C72|nr:iron ABC transporter permease [Curtobacterium sp. ME12]